MKSVGFYGLERNRENFNSYKFFNFLLASGIFSLALLFVFFFFLTGIVIASSMQKYVNNVL